MQFNALQISKVRRLTDSSVEVSFTVPEALKSRYEFSHGQFVTLRAKIGGESIERSYSICAAPYERILKVAIKQVKDGLFSTWANSELSENMSLEVSVPMGTFTNALDSSTKRDYLLIAAGSGITPILSIIKMTLASETRAKVTLIYANRSPETTMFADELQTLLQRYAGRLVIKRIYSRSNKGDREGRLSNQMLDELLKSTDLNDQAFDQAFICGPEALTLTLRDHLTDKLPAAKVNIELFTAVTSNGSKAPGDNNHAESSKICLTIDGEDIHFTYRDSTRSILDTALDYEPDLPYGCQNGSCGVCQAHLVSGDIEMTVNYALSESEVKDGYVLVCQAKPLSSKVSISYDE